MKMLLERNGMEWNGAERWSGMGRDTNDVGRKCATSRHVTSCHGPLHRCNWTEMRRIMREREKSSLKKVELIIFGFPDPELIHR